MMVNIIFKIFLFFFICYGHSICAENQLLEKHHPTKLDIEIDDNEYKDPAFFRLTTHEGRIIYILGTHHFVPLEHFFHKKTLEELNRIANEEKAILYSEHEVTNEINLKYLNSEENTIPAKAFQEGNTLFSGVEINLMPSERNFLFDNKKLMLNLENHSDIDFKEILKARLWLGAVILGTHAGILSYRMFGGTEHNLIHGSPKKEWKEIKYLETPEEVIEILKQNKDDDNDSKQNINWIKKSIDKLLVLAKHEESHIKILIKKEFTSSVKNYPGWESIRRSNSNIPHSVFGRNKHWVRTILRNSREEGHTPLLITVGSGHFVRGIQKDQSGFLHLLFDAVKGQKIERFSNHQNGWVNVSL